MTEPEGRHPLDYARPPRGADPGVPTPRGMWWLALLAAVGGAGGVWLAARIGSRADASPVEGYAALMLGGVSLTACAAGTATLFRLLIDRAGLR